MLCNCATCWLRRLCLQPIRAFFYSGVSLRLWLFVTLSVSLFFALIRTLRSYTKIRTFNQVLETRLSRELLPIFLTCSLVVCFLIYKWLSQNLRWLLVRLTTRHVASSVRTVKPFVIFLSNAGKFISDNRCRDIKIRFYISYKRSNNSHA